MIRRLLAAGAARTIRRLVWRGDDTETGIPDDSADVEKRVPSPGRSFLGREREIAELREGRDEAA
ncbi:MAG: hypothetical protein ACREQ9_06395, partial [Candidatus Binatia bacterium]